MKKIIKTFIAFEVINGFITKIEQAYLDIEDCKLSNPDMYDVYKDRIDVEGIAHYKALLDIYPDSTTLYTEQQKEIYKQRAISLLTLKKLKQLSVEEFEKW